MRVLVRGQTVGIKRHSPDALQNASFRTAATVNVIDIVFVEYLRFTFVLL